MQKGRLRARPRKAEISSGPCFAFSVGCPLSCCFLIFDLLVICFLFFLFFSCFPRFGFFVFLLFFLFGVVLAVVGVVLFLFGSVQVWTVGIHL